MMANGRERTARSGIKHAQPQWRTRSLQILVLRPAGQRRRPVGVVVSATGATGTVVVVVVMVVGVVVDASHRPGHRRHLGQPVCHELDCKSPGW